MATGTDENAPLSPDAAYSLLGNDTRVKILQRLGEAGEPLPFSDLREAVGTADSGQFNYHVDKLAGHFIQKTDDGYELRQAGRRVVMAVLSGAVTESPVIERTETDLPCTNCGAPTEITYHQGWIRNYCTACPGNYTEPRRGEPTTDVERGYLGSLPLPPAAVRGRSAEELVLTALAWGQASLLVMSGGLCPECGSILDESVTVCEDHAVEESICDNCDGLHAARIHHECTHCIWEWTGRFDNGLLAQTELQAFLFGHGINFISPTTNVWAQFDYEEEIRSTDPFEGRFTFTVDGDWIALTVDDDLTVTEVERGSTTAAD